MIDLSVIGKVNSLFNDLKSIQHWGLSIKGSDRLKIDEYKY